MTWFRRKTKPKAEPTDTNRVDLDRVRVPLHDMNDPTSLFFQISMRHGGAAMSWDDQSWVWTLRVGERKWEAPTQQEALTAAWNDLEKP